MDVDSVSALKRVSLQTKPFAQVLKQSITS